MVILLPVVSLQSFDAQIQSGHLSDVAFFSRSASQVTRLFIDVCTAHDQTKNEAVNKSVRPERLY